MTRRVAVVTGTRAEYGLLRKLLTNMREDSLLSLKLIVTGTHLSEKFGLTKREIKDDGFAIAAELPILQNSDSSVAISQSMSYAITGLTNSFKELQPDLVLILGDRFEIFAAAIAAHLSKIPVAHIHGGETTEGVMDEAFRHSITKLAQIHFVSTEVYRNRVIQLGENPRSVFRVGSLGVENLKSTHIIDRKKLEADLRFRFSNKNILVTYHPVTLDATKADYGFSELLKSLSELHETTLIFTYPNADVGGLRIIESIKQFVKNNPNAYAFPSLGQDRYFSCMKHVDVVVGNSSSGLIEVPSMKKPSINIGDRQSGRVRAVSVIDCPPVKEKIMEALELAFSFAFLEKIKNADNPYELEGTSSKILNTIKHYNLTGILKKKFYDLRPE